MGSGEDGDGEVPGRGRGLGGAEREESGRRAGGKEQGRGRRARLLSKAGPESLQRHSICSRHHSALTAQRLASIPPPQRSHARPFSPHSRPHAFCLSSPHKPSMAKGAGGVAAPAGRHALIVAVLGVAVLVAAAAAPAAMAIGLDPGQLIPPPAVPVTNASLVTDVVYRRAPGRPSRLCPNSFSVKGPLNVKGTSFEVKASSITVDGVRCSAAKDVALYGRWGASLTAAYLEYAVQISIRGLQSRDPGAVVADIVSNPITCGDKTFGDGTPIFVWTNIEGKTRMRLENNAEAYACNLAVRDDAPPPCQ